MEILDRLTNGDASLAGIYEATEWLAAPHQVCRDDEQVDILAEEHTPELRRMVEQEVVGQTLRSVLPQVRQSTPRARSASVMAI